MINDNTLNKLNEFTSFRNELMLISSKLKKSQNNIDICSRKINNSISGNFSSTLFKLNEDIDNVIKRIDTKYMPELNKTIDTLGKI